MSINHTRTKKVLLGSLVESRLCVMYISLFTLAPLAIYNNEVLSPPLFCVDDRRILLILYIAHISRKTSLSPKFALWNNKLEALVGNLSIYALYI